MSCVPPGRPFLIGIPIPAINRWATVCLSLRDELFTMIGRYANAYAPVLPSIKGGTHPQVSAYEGEGVLGTQINALFYRLCPCTLIPNRHKQYSIADSCHPACYENNIALVLHIGCIL